MKVQKHGAPFCPKCKTNRYVTAIGMLPNWARCEKCGHAWSTWQQW